MVVFRLVTAMLAPVFLSNAFYLLDIKTKFGKIPYIAKQIIIGVLFGILACLATQYGIPYDGYVLNVRSAAPLTAGLVFGGPAGIISGVMGALYRWFGVYWGVPSYTRIACSVATLLAGVLAAVCRKYMFSNKKTSWFYGMFIAIATEVFHMLLVFITHMDDIRTAFLVVKETAIIMISANAVSLLLSLLFVSVISKEKLRKKKYTRPITQTFSVYLFICVFLSFLATSIFTYALQKNVSDLEIDNLFSKNISDVQSDIRLATRSDSDKSAIENIAKNRHLGQSGFLFVISNDDGSIVSAPDGTVTESNVKRFENEIEKIPDFKVLTFKSDEGEVYYYSKAEAAGYTIIGCIPESEATFSQDISVYIGAFMQLVVFFILFLVVFFLIKRIIVDNIHKINESLAKITGGDLSTRVDVRENEEFTSLSNDINATVERLKDFISEAEKRIDMELAFAKSIQHSVLPSIFPPYPNNKDFDIYATMDTAKEVGGDFYDFYFIDHNHFAFLIADVSGKGIPAAMFMMNAKSVIKNLAKSGMTVDELFTTANNMLCENNDAGMFVTAWMGVLDLQTNTVSFANAGHNPPLVKHKDGSYEYLKTKAGLVLAGMEGISYKKGEFALEKGDEIFLYTDGVTEATNEQTELFGEERLKNVLNSGAFLTAEDVCTAVKKNVDGFVGNAPQFDDITMLSLKVGTPNTENKKELTVLAKTENIGAITDFIEETLLSENASRKAVTQINIAVDEIVSNIVRYAYPETQGDVTASIKISENVAEISFIDSGTPFNPLENEDPDITESAEERKIGGLGIFMVKKSMDSVDYKYENGKNILTITKKLGE